jgi:hypothetical protein
MTTGELGLSVSLSVLFSEPPNSGGGGVIPPKPPQNNNSQTHKIKEKKNLEFYNEGYIIKRGGGS